MPARGPSRNKISIRLVLYLALLLAAICFGVYKYAGNSTPSCGDESLPDEVDDPAMSLAEANKELSAQIGKLQEELRSVTEERDRLHEDKTQLLYMVEKLQQQQQAVKASAPGSEHGVSEKVVRSWLVRISEFRHAKISETAESRDEYVKEINEIVRGLKEDFAEDIFIMGIGYAKTSARVKSDISAAQNKLDEIILYLRAYSAGAD